MNRSETTPAALPVRLYQEGGYDVYIGNKRGTAASRTHETLDADVDADYWNWSIDEVGMYDIPAMINKIMQVRADEGLPAQKVTVVTNSVSSGEALITLSSYPTSADANIGQLVATAPCLVPTVMAVLGGFG